MELHNLQDGAAFRLVSGTQVPPDAPEVYTGATYTKRELDGLYARCKDEAGRTVYVVAYAEVEPV